MFKFGENLYEDIGNTKVETLEEPSNFSTFQQSQNSESPTAIQVVIQPNMQSSSSPSQASTSSSNYDTFGSFNRLSTDSQIAQWLAENNFDEKVIGKLSNFNGNDLLCLSKEDVKALIGTKDGIRLYNRLKQVKDVLTTMGDGGMTHKDILNAARTAQMLLSGGDNNEQYQTSYKSSGSSGYTERVSRSYVKTSTFQGAHCQTPLCNQGASIKCCIDTCEKLLCFDHFHKDILTGYSYCSSCAETQSYSNRIMQSRLHDMLCKLQ